MKKYEKSIKKYEKKCEKVLKPDVFRTFLILVGSLKPRSNTCTKCGVSLFQLCKLRQQALEPKIRN